MRRPRYLRSSRTAFVTCAATACSSGAGAYIRLMYDNVNYEMGFHANNAGFGALVEFLCRSAAAAVFGAQNSAVGAPAQPHSNH